MKKHMLLPSLALAGGAAAFALRLAQNRTGFEAATGLPVPGNVWAVLLVVLLAVLAAVCVLLARRLPREAAPHATFGDAFAVSGTGALTLLVAGVFLLGLSGLGELAAGAGILPTDIAFPAAGAALNARLSLVLGALGAACAGCLLSVLPACRRGGARVAGGESRKSGGSVLLLPVAYLVIRLVLTYRVDSVNPSLSVYYVELLAQVFLTLAFYRLSSFAFQAGQTRRFALYAVPAVVLCIATLADGHSLFSTLFYAGSGLTLLAFVLLRLDNLAAATD